MSRTIAGNLTGRAAQIDRMDKSEEQIAQEVRDAQKRAKAKKNVMDMAEKILEHMGQDGYDAFIIAGPEDNEAFDRYLQDKLVEIENEQVLAWVGKPPYPISLQDGAPITRNDAESEYAKRQREIAANPNDPTAPLRSMLEFPRLHETPLAAGKVG